MKKLIYLFNGRLPTEKAHGVQIARMCEAFANQGIAVELVVPYRENPIQESVGAYYGIRFPDQLRVKKVGGLDLQHYHWIPARLQFHFQNIISLFAILGAVWHERNDTMFYARDLSSLFALSFLGFDFVAEIHDYRLQRSRWFVKHICNQARAVVVNSEGTKQALLRHYQLQEDKILVAPNGVALDFFAIPETKAEAREKLGLPQDKIIIAYVGRAESAGVKKGFETFSRAMSEISDSGIVGFAIGVESSRQDTALRYAQALHREVPLYLRAIDIVVIPLPRGTAHAATTSPIKLFEFLAAGKAIIASDLPSLRQYLDETTAVFFNPESIEDLKHKIVELAQDKNRIAELERNTLTLAADYTWDHRAEKILAFIG